MDMSNIIMQLMLVSVISVMLLCVIIEYSIRSWDARVLQQEMVQERTVGLGVGSIIQVITKHERDVYADGSGVTLDACYVVVHDFQKLQMLHVRVMDNIRTLEYSQVRVIWKTPQTELALND